MVRVRNLALAIAAASALSSGAVHALGLGEVTLRSTLNQPLDAEIELLQVRDISSEELAPTLASPEAFSKAGVDRQHFLTDLKFTPIIKPNGKSVIRVTSSKPVQEPYLNFLVEVLWPSGRLLREYTLLLDPPLYSSQTAMSSAQKPLTEQRAGVIPRPRTMAPAASPRSAVSRPEAVAAPGAREYRTTTKDTLWVVAERVRTSGTVHQTMLAIQDLNPDAFLGGNINRLLSGQVLHLPDEQQVRRRSEGQALAEVAAQNAAWRERRARPAVASAPQLDATRRSEADAVPAKIETGDNLRLVAANTGKAVAGSDKGGDGLAASDKLALLKESLDTTQRENTELTGRMDDLQGQLDKLQRLIALKDEQLAKLQENLAHSDKPAEGGTETSAGVTATLAPSKPVAAQVPPAAPAPDVVAPAPLVTPPEAPAASSGEVASAAPVHPAPEPVAQEAAAQSAVDSVAASVPVTQPPAPEPAKPVIEPAPQKPAVHRAAEPVPPVGLVDSILDSPLLLPSLGGGAAAALLFGLLWARRRATKRTEPESAGEIAAVVEAPLVDANAADTELLRPTIDLAKSDEVQQAPLIEPKERDALVEAEEHLAHGRLEQAAELLQAACLDEPERNDLRLKLMEVYAERGDRDSFTREEKLLREVSGAPLPQVETLKARYPAMAGLAVAALAGGALAAGLAAADGEDEEAAVVTMQEPELEPSTPVLAPAAADLDLNLDDLEAELERDLQAADQEAPALLLEDLSPDEAPLAASDPDLLDEDFSFDLDLSEGVEGFDLEEDLKGLALDLDEPVEPKPSEKEDEDFLSLDLDDLDDLDAPVVTPLAESVPSGDELPVNPDDRAVEAGLAGEPQSVAPNPELSPVDAPEAETESLTSQLGELDVELEQLAAGLGETSGEGRSAMDLLDSLDTLGEGEDFDFLAEADEVATKLDLARAYIEMGDAEGAKDILDEVLTEGNEAQREEAREMSVQLA